MDDTTSDTDAISGDTNEMTTDSAANAPVAPMRVWPLPVLLLLMLLTRAVAKFSDDGQILFLIVSVFGPIVCGALILGWWLLLSRVGWQERLIGIVGVAVIAGLTFALLDSTMMGPGLMFITVPVGTAAFAIAALIFSAARPLVRVGLILVSAALGFGFSDLIRGAGMDGDFAFNWDWRWNPTPEELMLAGYVPRPDSAAVSVSEEDAQLWFSTPEWPSFRGDDRTSRYAGAAIATDWSVNHPELVWKINVGPAWSSFAVAGDLLFTQEQRGPEETVVCYEANSGFEIWTQSIETRFYEALGGAGPRATPTLSGQNVYAFGANGNLLKLSALTGEIEWSADVQKVAKRKPPMWGFSASPLVTDTHVIVHAGGSGELGTLAFDVATGELSWSAPAGDHTYSSPQLADVAGQQLVLMATNDGLDFLNPETGVIHHSHDFPIQQYRSLQPQIVDGVGVLLETGSNDGIALLGVSGAEDSESFETQEVWVSKKLKPDFNDFVVHDGHAYGFDGAIFACIDLADGQRAWKKGRYGKGQVLLLQNSGVLLVATEKGEVVLLKLDPTESVELARFQALEGKTWNHPVVVGDRLFIRNAKEAACYRLPM